MRRHSIPRERLHLLINGSNIMSFAFNVKGKEKSQLIALALIELDKVVAQQAVHALDKDAIIKAAEVYVETLPTNLDNGHDYVLAINGSVIAYDSDIAGCNVGINLAIVKSEL